MNERIKELAIQAAGKGFETFATSDFDSPAKIQTFAELIVKECVGRVRYCIQNDLDYIAEDIEQHFGVSE